MDNIYPKDPTNAYDEETGIIKPEVLAGILGELGFRNREGETHQKRCCLCFFHISWDTYEPHTDGKYYCGHCGYWSPDSEEALKHQQENEDELVNRWGETFSRSYYDKPTKRNFDNIDDTTVEIKVGPNIIVPKQYWLHPTIIIPD